MNKNSKSQGFSHHLLLPILVILIIGVVGVITVTRINAAKGNANKKPSSVFTIATWNLLYTNDKQDIPGIKAFLGRAEILGVQEFNNRDGRYTEANKKLLCSKCAYDGYMPKWKTLNKGATPASQSVFWNRSKFEEVKKGYEQAYGDSDTKTYEVSKGGGGKEVVGSRFIVWVLLRNKATGQQFYYINTHTISTVDSSGKPSKYKDRVAMYKKHMDNLTTIVKDFQKTGYPIFITGDFNVDYRTDVKVKYKNFPFTKLGAVNVHSNWERLGIANLTDEEGTQNHGNRIIDYVWASDNNKVQLLSTERSLYTHGSDHYGVVLKLRLFNQDRTL